MFEIPSPYRRPSRSNAEGWKPGTDRSHGSRPEYDVSMWPLNMRLFPPPAPARVPRTFARPSSTCCHCTCRPIESSVCAISSAIACSSPVKLCTPIIREAVSTRRSRSIFTMPLPADQITRIDAELYEQRGRERGRIAVSADEADAAVEEVFRAPGQDGERHVLRALDDAVLLALVHGANVDDEQIWIRLRVRRGVPPDSRTCLGEHR